MREVQVRMDMAQLATKELSQANWVPRKRLVQLKLVGIEVAG